MSSLDALMESLLAWAWKQVELAEAESARVAEEYSRCPHWRRRKRERLRREWIDARCRVARARWKGLEAQGPRE